MAALTVVGAGLQTTVQDLGRQGYRHLGVPFAGAMDAYALRVANLLVGNPEDAAGLEFLVRGPCLQFEDDRVVAICGGSFDAELDGRAVHGWRPLRVRAGAVLDIRNVVRGLRGCLAVSGGIDTAPVLGSRSTYLRAGLGGLEGRALRNGDPLPLGPSPEATGRLFDSLPAEGRTAWSVSVRDVYPPDPQQIVLRAYPGTHAPLSPTYVEEFYRTEFQVRPESDRMGYRLGGGPSSSELSGELISEPVCPGTIQQPPGGEAIVLLADAQTTGGYARMAHLALVDLPVLAQAGPGARVRFQPVTREAAIALRQARERDLLRLQRTLALRST